MLKRVVTANLPAVVTVRMTVVKSATARTQAEVNNEHALVQDSGHCVVQEWEIMCCMVMRTLRDER